MTGCGFYYVNCDCGVNGCVYVCRDSWRRHAVTCKLVLVGCPDNIKLFLGEAMFITSLNLYLQFVLLCSAYI